jgi:hypothetical protein
MLSYNDDNNLLDCWNFCINFSSKT